MYIKTHIFRTFFLFCRKYSKMVNGRQQKGVASRGYPGRDHAAAQIGRIERML